MTAQAYVFLTAAVLCALVAILAFVAANNLLSEVVAMRKLAERNADRADKQEKRGDDWRKSCDVQQARGDRLQGERDEALEQLASIRRIVAPDDDSAEF